jgi:RES domain-containing protein
MSRHPESDRLARAIARCLDGATAYRGVLFRSAAPQYANKDDLLTGAGSRVEGARWNPPLSFRTVYTSLNPETALAEVLAHFRHYKLPVHKAMPRVIVSVEAKLTGLLDLTDSVVRKVLGVAEKRLLTEPWRKLQKRGKEALTQAIGRLAYESDFEGLIVPSAAQKGGTNVIVFPANLDAPSSGLRIINKNALPSGI